MPHDKHGRLIEPGDLVVGRGYNIKKDIIAEVLSVNPHADSCNISVMTLAAEAVTPDEARGIAKVGGRYYFTSPAHDGSGKFFVAQATVEYGATKDFEIVRKHDGSRPSTRADIVHAEQREGDGL